MPLNPEQILVRGSLKPNGNGQSTHLHLDPPIAGTRSVLLRGRVEVPSSRRPLDWLFRRRSPLQTELNGTVLQVRLPEDDESRELPLGADGSFEARLESNLKRLRTSGRQVVFTLRHRDVRIEQLAPLFMPRPGATRAIVVLGRGEPVVRHTSPEATAAPNSIELSECGRELTTLLKVRGSGFTCVSLISAS